MQDETKQKLINAAKLTGKVALAGVSLPAYMLTRKGGDMIAQLLRTTFTGCFLAASTAGVVKFKTRTTNEYNLNSVTIKQSMNYYELGKTVDATPMQEIAMSGLMSGLLLGTNIPLYGFLVSNPLFPITEMEVKVMDGNDVVSRTTEYNGHLTYKNIAKAKPVKTKLTLNGMKIYGEKGSKFYGTLCQMIQDSELNWQNR